MSLFERGRPKTGGHGKGARNKMSQAFLEAFAAEWEARGAECLRVMAIEHPSDFVKIAVSLLPKEFEITQTQLMEIPDERTCRCRSSLLLPLVALPPVPLDMLEICAVPRRVDPGNAGEKHRGVTAAGMARRQKVNPPTRRWL
jgi:hypothetical protein